MNFYYWFLLKSSVFSITSHDSKCVQLTLYIIHLICDTYVSYIALITLTEGQFGNHNVIIYVNIMQLCSMNCTYSSWVCMHLRWNWRMVSSGILCRVALVITDVSEDLSASFIRVKRIGELGTTLALTSNRRTLRRSTKLLVTVSVVRSSPILILKKGAATLLRNVGSYKSHTV
jgi:hypothetical protein